ncbi:exonuclease VII small subunit [Candidatus Pelagibacter sp.]|nr:exonuclease VII small subunit [Candidatus Pelagibacter sp.]
MKEKNLPLDYQHSSLEELTEKANSIIESLENEKNLNNSIDTYQELLKLNNLIEKKFQKNLKSISETTNNKIKEIVKKNEK